MAHVPRGVGEGQETGLSHDAFGREGDDSEVGMTVKSEKSEAANMQLKGWRCQGHWFKCPGEKKERKKERVDSLGRPKWWHGTSRHLTQLDRTFHGPETKLGPGHCLNLVTTHNKFILSIHNFHVIDKYKCQYPSCYIVALEYEVALSFALRNIGFSGRTSAVQSTPQPTIAFCVVAPGFNGINGLCALGVAQDY
ncbi:hypothetical protein N7535_006906 [Penicillium sp. DV-2018c]|nr:hypothetical protein N7461_007010 [Penicillium sp. DV-2018c]KAJ5567600.1 hypothetical protein N7535_006906 [Penicillium sp. DV-2018c]